MTNTVLANYANLTLYLAMAVLTVAMIAFAVYVAVTTSPRTAAGKGSLAESGEPSHASGSQSPEAERDALLLAVGVTRAGATGEPAAGPTGPGRGTRDDRQAGAADVRFDDRGRRDGRAIERPGGRRSGQLGMTLSWLGAMLLVLSVALRGASVQRPPVGNMFEFAVFGATLVMVVYLGLALRWPLRWLGLFVVLPVLLALGLALTVWYTEAAELLPSLKSIWLAIHVPVAVLAVAVFTIAFSVLLVHLAQAYRETLVAEGRPRPRWTRFLDELPSARTLDRAAYALHVVAFPLWTFSLIAGAIWAQEAWGTYWNWDPKEVWTFVIWVIYAAYLHARATSGWSLRTANVLAVLGYVAIIVNFAVVNVFFIGQHSYSGLG